MTLILTAEDQEKIIKDYIKANYCFGDEEPVLQNSYNVFNTEWEIKKGEIDDEAESESTKG